MANDEQKPVAKKKVAKKTVAKKAASKKAPAKKAASAPQASSAAGNSSKAANGGRMRVTLIKSLIGTIGHHRDTVRGLGLRRLNHTVELEDTPATRGMVKKVQYLVRVEKG